MSTTVKRDKERPQQVQVFIRSRPLNKQELESRSCTAVEILNSKELAVRQQYGKHYTFDKIFGPYVKQLDVYASVVEPLIPEVLDGYNCTVFAYGQTGTGKTYTMAGGSVPAVGISWQDDQEAGIIPRALSHLFDELCLIQQQYTVRVSYLELYNEELFDLLSDNVEGKGIRIFEDQHQKGSVIINGIVKETVHNKNEVYEILQKGQEKRRTASTLLNAQSSRSHTVFSIMVHTCETTVEGEELVKTGKLNLVDLAGSENISRSGAVDRRAREAGNINQSLLTLGRVIKALVERSAHIPYRESKLTRILQDSLGGRTKTSIIATISPAVVCLEETLSTLEYASRARNITNRPEVNQRVSQKAWKAQYEKEMERLRKDLHAARTGSGVFLDQENYDRLVNDSEICKEELAEKIANVRELQQQLRNLEIQKEIQEVEWTKMLLSFQETRNKLTEYRNRLKKTIVEKKEQEHLAFCYEAKAETLHDQAQKLLGMTKVTAVNFRKKIDNLCSMSQENTDSMKKISEKVITKCQEVTNELIDFMINFNDCNKNATNLMKAMQEQHIKSYEATELCGNNTIAEVRNLINVTCQDLENSYDVDRQQQEKILGKIEEKLQEIKDMTKWVDVKIDLEHIREDLLSNLDSTNKHLTKQQAITEDTANDIRMIDEDINLIHKTVKSVMKRIQLVEQRVSESKDVNCVYMDRINNTQVIVENRILKVSSDLQINIDQAAHLLTEAVNIIQENKEQNLAIVKMLEQLHKCKQNFGNHDQTESKHTVETCLQNLHDITRNHMETAKISKCELSSNSDKIHTQLSQLAEITSQHQEATISGLQECQENLVNLVNGLTDINPGSNTPIRVHFDPSSLAQPSPRDRILMRFHDRYKELSFNESLDFKDEDTLPAISTLPYLPVEDTDIPLHILRSNVQHIQCQDDYLQKKSQKYDKENVPGPSKNTS